MTNEQVRDIASSFTWKDLEKRFQEAQAKTSGRSIFERTEWESGDVSEKWAIGGSPVWQVEFEHLASICARKLGYTDDNEPKDYWLKQVRDWMQQGRLDEDSKFARSGTGYRILHGAMATTQDLATERIAELSAMLCIHLIASGTPEWADPQAAAANPHKKPKLVSREAGAMETVNRDKGIRKDFARLIKAGMLKRAAARKLEGEKKYFGTRGLLKADAIRKIGKSL